MTKTTKGIRIRLRIKVRAQNPSLEVNIRKLALESLDRVHINVKNKLPRTTRFFITFIRNKINFFSDYCLITIKSPLL